MKKKKFFFLLFCFLFSCREGGKNHLEEYFDNLPVTEKENQSILAKEIFTEEIKQKYNQKRYREVLTKIENYYMVREGEEFFNESSFYFDRSIFYLMQQNLFKNYYSNKNTNRKFYSSFRKKKKLFIQINFCKKLLQKKKIIP